MKSINKYELLEAITTGAVEAFVAKEKEGGLPRLVYLVGWAGAAEHPTTREILQHFRSVAPDPPGVILDAGREVESGRVYLVTSMPSDPLAVQTWLEAYRGAEAKTAGASAAAIAIPQRPTPPANSAPQAPPPRAPEPAAQPSAGEFTRMFREIGPASGSKNIAAPSNPRPANPPSVPPPSRPPQPSVPNWEANRPQQAPGDFTKEFFGGESVKKAEPESKMGPGEFTNFMNGMGPSEAPPPKIQASVSRAPEPGPGEFTRMFGAPGGSAPAQSSPNPILDQGASGPKKALDDSFNFGVPPSPQSPPPLAASNPPRPANLDPIAPPPRAAEPQSFAAPAPSPAPFRPNWGGEQDAGSRVFRPADVPSPKPAAVTPAGPSEFTRIVSGGKKTVPPPPPEPVAAAPVTPPTPVPVVPAAPVAIPAVPAVPQPPVFAPPAIAAPAPVLPPKAPGKASSYWPLIIILNVVLIAAVALVLYFVLKPH